MRARVICSSVNLGTTGRTLVGGRNVLARGLSTSAKSGKGNDFSSFWIFIIAYQPKTHSVVINFSTPLELKTQNFSIEKGPQNLRRDGQEPGCTCHAASQESESVSFAVGSSTGSIPTGGRGATDANDDGGCSEEKGREETD